MSQKSSVMKTLQLVPNVSMTDMENTVFCSRVAYRENAIRKFAPIPLVTYSPEAKNFNVE
jgi:hypothetical protein